MAPMRPRHAPCSAAGRADGLRVAGRRAWAGAVVGLVRRAHAASLLALRGDDLGVGRAVRQQLVVGAEADTAAVLEHQDLVGVDDRGHPLGHHDDGGVAR